MSGTRRTPCRLLSLPHVLGRLRGPLAGLALAALLVTAFASLPAFAGPAPGACRTECDMESDIIVFAQGDADFEINATLVECSFCSLSPDGSTFTIRGRAEVQYGPYQVCDVNAGVVDIVIGNQNFVRGLPGGPEGNEQTYVPQNPAEVFTGDHSQSGPLRTLCLDESYLDYRVPQTFYTRAEGAKSAALASGDAAFLRLPFSVRFSEDGDSKTEVLFEPLQIPQDLLFDFSVDNDVASLQRFWPESLPFRLSPTSTRYLYDIVSLNYDSASAFTPYEAAPPDAALGSNFVPLCPTFAGLGTIPCTGSRTISNLGYFDLPDWEPGPTTFTSAGMDLSLALPSGSTVVYETLYPRGIWLELEGPASVSIASSGIQGGSFSAGHTWLQQDRVPGCGIAQLWKFALNTGTSQPQIGENGSVMAGVTDLSVDLSNNPKSGILWTFNEATNLGCGTVYAPPIPAFDEPAELWYQSAVQPVRGRGIYPGLNYNRQRVCQAADGNFTENFCISDGDCDGGAGETCVDGGFAPLCPDPPPESPGPTWNTQINGSPKNFRIHPQFGTASDREMVFVARLSGVTGVFDGGDGGFVVAGPPLDFSFDRYGVAFKISTNELADTITEGSVRFDWPADESLPFQDLSQCTCGKPMSADSPDVLIEKRLLYWDAEFQPYGLDFFAFPNPAPPPGQSPCPVTSVGADGMCGNTAVADAVCVAALTPVPHIEPEFDSDFFIRGNGQAGGIKPMVVNRVGFDRHISMAEPFSYDLELFELNEWPGNSSASRDAVVGFGTARWGYYHSFGEISLPFFGLTRAGIRVEREQGGLFHFAHMHEEGFPDSPASTTFSAQRKSSGDTLTPTFDIDYLRPSLVRDFNAEADITGAGQGILFAHAEPSQLDLGSVAVAGALIMDPDDILYADIGPSGAMRLWGYAQNSKPEAQQALETLLGSARANFNYQPVIDKLLAQNDSGAPWDLPPSEAMREAIYASGAVSDLAAHPDVSGTYNVQGDGTPPKNASNVYGYLDFSSTFNNIDFFQVGSNVETGGEFYELDSTLLSVDRHVMQNEEPIQTFTREEIPFDSDEVSLPAEQSIQLPGGSFMEWLFDYEVTINPPSFKFKSLTGTLDLTKGGLSGLGFDEMGATLKFYADATWYFDAGLKLNYKSFSGAGAILLGATADILPLKQRDPIVASFIDATDFYGGYARLGLSYKAVDFGCLLRASVGASIGGWYINGGFGGKVRGWLSGTGGCLVSVRGDLTLLGGEVNDRFKLGGNFWVAGGIGFCDPDGWDTLADVHNDDWCAACSGEVGVTGTFPPEDLDIKISGPNVKCTL